MIIKLINLFGRLFGIIVFIPVSVLMPLLTFLFYPKWKDYKLWIVFYYKDIFYDTVIRGNL